MSTSSATTPAITAAAKPVFRSVMSLPSAVLGLVTTAGYLSSAIATTTDSDGWAPTTINRMALPTSTLRAEGLTAGVLLRDALGARRATAVARTAGHHGPGRCS
jgi:hypothetical protein